MLRKLSAMPIRLAHRPIAARYGLFPPAIAMQYAGGFGCRMLFFIWIVEQCTKDCITPDLWINFARDGEGNYSGNT